jgi:PAS domain S-box-containing protein
MDDKQAIQVWVRDISEQKRLEEERALSEKRLGELYDSVSDLIYTQDIEGRFTSANRAMAGLFDLTPAEMVGIKASAFMKPELAPLFESDYLEKMKEQGHYEGITAYIAGDNHKFYIDYRSVLVRPPHGEPYISGIGRDVTDQILAQRKIRESVERMQAVLDASPGPIVAYDVAGNVIFMNKSFTQVFGWTIEEMNGKPIPFVPEDQRVRTLQPIKDLYSGKRTGVINLETVRLTKVGVRLDILVSAALIAGSEGKPSGMVVSLTDLTAQKKMESALQQAQKMEAIGVLAGGIAHDFNNLLMGIQGNVSLLLLNKDLNDGLRRNIENIEALVSRGANLTRQLLGFARGGKYEVKTYDICDILEVESALFGDTHKEIVVERNPAPDLWKVDVDRSQIEQVFMNLFVNAGQAMPKGGNLYLGAENVIIDDTLNELFQVNPGRYVKVSVTDTGTGMDEDTSKRIFEPFFTTKEKGKGTGLGLASVYGIVKNHGGFIKVYSEPGKGTSFHVYLPASDAVVAEKKTGSVAKDTMMHGEGTILLVDDETMIVDVGKEMLEMMGYRVIGAYGGKEAIEKFAAVKNKTGEVDRIDLVIQDMIMPGVGGGDLFDRLRELDPDVKVILSSGYSLNGEAKEILARGCREFIQKPFSIDALSRKVHEILK